MSASVVSGHVRLATKGYGSATIFSYLLDGTETGLGDATAVAPTPART